MNRGRAVLAAVLAALAAVVVPMAGTAAANHTVENDQLWVTIAVNAAGDDRISVGGDMIGGSSTLSATASEVAIALDRPEGSFREVDEYGYGYVVLEDKLATADNRGGLSYPIDTGKLQLLAQREGFEVVLLKVCTPKVRQVVAALVTPEDPGFESPASRCRGWYQEVGDPAIRAVLQLAPDRDRYPSAVVRMLGTTAITFGILGLGATLLRRGPLGRRSVASWLVSTGVAVVVALVGWGAATIALWWSGANADPVLLSGGTVGEQVARTLLPGLAFLVPALLPAAILLSVPRKERPLPAPPAPQAAPVAQQQAAWWPTAWWGQWAATRGTPAPVTVPGPPSPPAQLRSPGPPTMSTPPDPPAAVPQGWAPPR